MFLCYKKCRRKCKITNFLADTLHHHALSRSVLQPRLIQPRLQKISQPPSADYPLLPRAALRRYNLLPRGKFFLSP